MCWFVMPLYLESCIWPDAILQWIRQRECIWFCENLGKCVTETLAMIKQTGQERKDERCKEQSHEHVYHLLWQQGRWLPVGRPKVIFDQVASPVPEIMDNSIYMCVCVCVRVRVCVPFNVQNVHSIGISQIAPALTYPWRCGHSYNHTSNIFVFLRSCMYSVEYFCGPVFFLLCKCFFIVILLRTITGSCVKLHRFSNLDFALTPRRPP
jgi:hypothetical protein